MVKKRESAQTNDITTRLRRNNMSSSKFITKPKAIYPLSIENLSQTAAYSPNATEPDSIVSKVDLPAGALFIPITAATEAPRKAWSTLQVSKNRHVELNSALMYLNHSCSPSLEIDTDMLEVRVSKDRSLKVGDELSFFYPSTEFEMDQPFECLCGAADDICLKTVTGAAEIDLKILQGWFVNEHIIKLKQEQDGGNCPAGNSSSDLKML